MIQPPKITWLTCLPNEKNFVERPELYAGVLMAEDILEVDFQIWNNQYGTEEVKALENFNIVASFDHLEDCSLLQYTKMLVNHSYVVEPVVNNNEAVFKMPDGIKLAGDINDGTTKSYGNYMVIKLILKAPDGVKVKTNDLKTFSLDIVKL